MTKNIMIVGVGGQGTLLASRILGNTVINEGYDVKVSEVHGMSQRGGSVVTYVKYGDKVYSPIIDEGEADIILAFELLEAYRALPYLKKGGKIIVNGAGNVTLDGVTASALEANSRYGTEFLVTGKTAVVNLISIYMCISTKKSAHQYLFIIAKIRFLNYTRK